jgi:hypothetical protein
MADNAVSVKEIIVFDNIADPLPPDINLTFIRLVERGVLSKDDADTFTNLAHTDDTPTSAGIEVNIQYVMRYTRPLTTGTTECIHATIAEFAPPNGIGDDMDIYGFIADPMKPRESITPYNSPMDLYKPLVGTTYTLADVATLILFINTRIQTVARYILYDTPYVKRVQIRPISYAALPRITHTGDILDKRLADIRAANIMYNIHTIRMKMLQAYAWKKYHRAWANLDDQLQKAILFEIAQRDAAVQKKRENTCGHKECLSTLNRRMAQALRAGIRRDIVTAAYDELAAYYAPIKSQNDYIMCANCAFPIMCPHYDVYCRTTSMAIVAKTFGEHSGSAFTCRVCGEYLFHSVELSESLEIASRQRYMVGDDITKTINTMCSFMIYQYLLIPRRNFAELLSACVDSILLKIRRRLTGKFVKFFTLERIDIYTQIIVAAYCAAFVVQILMQFPDIRLRAVLDMPDTAKGRLAGYLQYFYNILSKLYNQQILGIMSLEEFAQLLYEAYKSISAQIVLTDTDMDDTVYDVAGVCYYVAFATGKKLPTFDQAQVAFAKITTPYARRIKAHVSAGDVMAHNATLHAPREQSLTLDAFRMYAKDSHVPSGAVYDQNGQPHLWILGKCRICGDTYADVCDRNVDAAVYAAGLAESFYNAFAINCPEGDHHQGMPCVKCGMGLAYDIAVIEKYKQQYYDMRRVELVPIYPRTNQTIVQAQWTINKSIFNEFAKLYGVADTRVRNLGLISGTLLRSIESGEIAPFKNADNYRTQGNVLFQYSTMLISQYNDLRFASHDAPPMVRSIINMYPDELSALVELPDINYTLYASLPDDLYNNYMFSYFLGTLIWLNKAGLMKSFAQYFVAYIFSYDSIFAKTDLQAYAYTDADYGLADDVDGEPGEDPYDDIDTDDMKTNMGYVE